MVRDSWLVSREASAIQRRASEDFRTIPRPYAGPTDFFPPGMRDPIEHRAAPPHVPLFFLRAREKWLIVGVVAIAAFALETAWSFWVGVVCVLTLLVGTFAPTYEDSQNRRQFIEYWEGWPARARAAWDLWAQSRVMARIAAASDPLWAARNEVANRGTLVIGTTADMERELTVAPKNKSLLVVAPSQSRKTYGINIPTILTYPGAVLSASTKIDVLENTARIRSGLGRCWLFDPLHSIRDEDLPELPPGAEIVRAYWTPLWEVRDWDAAREVAFSLVSATSLGQSRDSNSEHWQTTTRTLLAPLLLAAALHEDATMQTVRDWVLEENSAEALGILADVGADDAHPMNVDAHLALKHLLSRVNDKDVRHRSAVWSTAQTVTEVFSAKPMLLDAHFQNFDTADFVRSTGSSEPQTLYIAAPAHKQAQTAGLNVALIDSVYRAITELEHAQAFHQGGRQPLLCSLDEARNIAPTPYLMHYLSEGLGQGFQTMVFLQTLSQAEAAWGVEGRDIASFATVKVIFGGVGHDATQEAFSTLCGEHEKVRHSQQSTFGFNQNTGGSVSHGQSGTNWSTGTSTSTGQTTSTSKERRVSKADVANVPRGLALVAAMREDVSPEAAFSPDRPPNFVYAEVCNFFGPEWQRVAQAPVAHRDHGPVQIMSRPFPPLDVPIEAYGVAWEASTASKGGGRHSASQSLGDSDGPWPAVGSSHDESF